MRLLVGSYRLLMSAHGMMMVIEHFNFGVYDFTIAGILKIDMEEWATTDGH